MSRLRRLVRLVDLRRPRRGLLSGDKLRAFLAQYLPPDLTFRDLRLPLALKAVDLGTGLEVALSDGSVLEAALATSAFPGVLPPVVIDGRCLVDGGVLDNLPTDLVRALGAERIDRRRRLVRTRARRTTGIRCNPAARCRTSWRWPSTPSA